VKPSLLTAAFKNTWSSKQQLSKTPGRQSSSSVVVAMEDVRLVGINKVWSQYHIIMSLIVEFWQCLIDITNVLENDFRNLYVEELKQQIFELLKVQSTFQKRMLRNILLEHDVTSKSSNNIVTRCQSLVAMMVKHDILFMSRVKLAKDSHEEWMDLQRDFLDLTNKKIMWVRYQLVRHKEEIKQYQTDRVPEECLVVASK
jgi:hypothetical protein